MDRVYAQGPRIRNELVNRNRLSSQAAAARNKLFRHMLEGEQPAGTRHPEVPAGARGLPLRSPGRKSPRRDARRLGVRAARRLRSPQPRARLEAAWTLLMAATEDAPAAFNALADALAEPPIGMRRGIFPIMFLHYYVLHRYEIACYDEGVYTPTLTYEHLERLVRRPDLFAFQRFRIKGVRADLFDEYGRALLDRKPDTDDPAAASAGPRPVRRRPRRPREANAAGCRPRRYGSATRSISRSRRRSSFSRRFPRPAATTRKGI